MTTTEAPVTLDDLTILSNRISSDQKLLQEAAMRLDLDIWNKIKGSELAKRAITVAAVQKQPILFIGPAGSGKSMLRCAAGQMGVPAFELTSPSRYAVARDFQKWAQKASTRKQIAKAKLFVEVSPPTTRDLSSRYKGTSIDDVKTSLARACQVIVKLSTIEVKDLDENCTRLLRQAQEELNMNGHEMETVMATARSIAGLDGSDTIELVHIAEAVQYRNPIR